MLLGADGRLACRALRAALGAIALSAPGLAAQNRPVDLTIREGTNVAASVSPDGRTIAFDLLGRIWLVPRNGGRARPITDLVGDARQPTWSPDGRRIAFQSYRDGAWHLWSVAADGAGLTQHTRGRYDDREPDYSPDGRYLVFSSDRSGHYDLWRLELASGRLERLTDDPAEDYAPAVSPDGESIAFVSNRRPEPGIWVRGADGTALLWVQAGGQLGGPAWSPDGRTIVYQQLDRMVTRLVAAERGGEPRRLSLADEDVFPFRPNWESAGEILYTADGGIRRIRPDGKRLDPIPFEARVSFVRRPWRRAPRRFDTGGSEPVQGIVSPAISPDGRSVAFVALGDLWILSAGRLTRLTDDPFVETGPAWSPEGGRLLYTSDRAGQPELWLRDLASESERRVTRGGSGATLPSWSPDGRRIAAQVQRGLGAELQVIDVATGEAVWRRPGLFGPSRASWSPDGNTLAVAALRTGSSRFREGWNEVLLIDLDGGADRRFMPLGDRGLSTRGTDGPVWSPDGTTMAFVADGVLWVVPVSPTGEPTGRPGRLSEDLAGAPSWTTDSKSILFQTDDGLRKLSLADRVETRIPVPLGWRRWNPTRRLVVHAGRLWTGRGRRLERDVDVIIEGHRIVRLTPHAARHHRDSVVDGTNLTVLPGLADAHAHAGFGTGEALGRTWLAYGITTIRDPAADPFDIRERREAVESGVRAGPRELATGRILDGDRVYYGLNNAVATETQLERELVRADRFRFDLIKTYVRLPDRLQSRVIAFAHQHGIAVSSHELYPAVAFGADHVEHIRGTSRRGYSPKVSARFRSYQDVIGLLTASGMTLTPTIGIQGGFFWLIARDTTVLDDPRLAIGYGPGYVRSLRAQAGAVPPELMQAQGETVRRVVAGGGRVIAGTDAPIIPYGLSLLTELEHLADAGLAPAEVLRTATSGFAEAMGLEADLGSIGPGRLADLIVVSGNPLERITDLRNTKIVIKNGEVFTVDRLLAGPIDRRGRRAPPDLLEAATETGAKGGKEPD